MRYNTFKKNLGNLGFKLNKYDPYVANKVINGEQCTVCWYMDYTKISHKDSKVVDMVIKEIEEKIGKMVVNRGKKYNFVGMDIELRDGGTVKKYETIY